MVSRSFFLPLLASVFCLSAPALAGPLWPRFRGAEGNGAATDDPRLPERWSATENVLWKTAIPGLGWSSPVVCAGRVFVTSVETDAANEKPQPGLYLGEGRRTIPEGTHRWMVSCLDLATGALLWKHTAHEGRPPVGRHPKSSYASETPATDGERLYVLFGDLGLYAYDLEGALLWSAPVAPRKTMADYGAAGSPVVHEGQVFVVYDNDEESWLAAYDARSGAERWRRARDEKTTWATPFVWQNPARTELIVAGKRRIRSYDLEGGDLWDMDGRMSNLVIPSPFAAEGLLYIASGYVGDAQRPVYAIRPGASGDITLDEEETASEFVQWSLPKAGPYNTSPLVYRNVYYTLLDRGMMTAHDARTGAELYGRTRFPSGASFTASPWAYNGKVFCLSETGTTYVLEAGPEFKLLGANALEGMCLATPAIADGKLLLRTDSSLYCLTQAGE